MRLILFDIDGTLLWTNGAGRRAIHRALLDEVGTAGPIDGYRFDGKTDPQIVRELLELAGHPESRSDDRITAVCRRYVDLLTAELAKPTQTTKLYPGIKELLAALEPYETDHRALAGGLREPTWSWWATHPMTSRAPVRWGPAPLGSRRDSTTRRRSELRVRRTCSRTWATRKRCCKRCSRDGRARGARAQSSSGECRRGAQVDPGSRGRARLPRRHDGPALRSQGSTRTARRSRAPARLPSGR